MSFAKGDHFVVMDYFTKTLAIRSSRLSGDPKDFDEPIQLASVMYKHTCVIERGQLANSRDNNLIRMAAFVLI